MWRWGKVWIHVIMCYISISWLMSTFLVGCMNIEGVYCVFFVAMMTLSNSAGDWQYFK